MPQTLYVNPTTGNDTATGSQSAPLKTITKALQQVQPDTTIQLATGNYNGASGEIFPLQVPSGVTILGNEGTKGSGILIEGSGQYTSATLGLQNITFLLANSTALRGVTVTNLARRGTAAWIESTNPTVANCTFTKCNREGVLATGNANPTILNNVFFDNGGNGISITKSCAGELRGNSCKKTGYGISIDGNATTKVVNNTIAENRFGMSISVDSKPVLRNNVIEICEVVFTVVFATECLLKVIAYGFMKGRHAYIRDGWNVLDFIIVVIRYVLYESCGCLFVPLLSTNICNSCRNSFAVLLALFQVCPAPTCRCFVAFVY